MIPDTIPDTMKAFVLHGHGGAEQLVYHTDWPTPKPKPGEVLIRVAACGLNNTDINTRLGWYADSVKTATNAEDLADAKITQGGGWGGRSIAFPRIQGADITGHIVAVGEGVEASRIGERVLVDYWILTHSDWLNPKNAWVVGSECDGGFAEFTALPSRNAIAIDTPLSDAELAGFPCSLSTAENMVCHARVEPGETVVITGASGGVGGYAVQLCHARKAKIIALANPAKTDALMALGADCVIDRTTPDLEAAIRAAAGGAVDVALDVVGAGQTEAVLRALVQGGRYACSGAIAGPMIDFDLRLLYLKDLHMMGATIVPPKTMPRLIRLIESGAIRPMLAQSFPLQDLHQAQEAFLAKHHTGNIVVTC